MNILVIILIAAAIFAIIKTLNQFSDTSDK